MYPKGHSGRGLALAVAIIVGAAGCSSRIEEVGIQPVKAPASKNAVQLTAEQQALVDTAWQAYQKLTSIYIRAAQSGEYHWDEDVSKRPMYDYAAGVLLAGLERDLGLMQEQGMLRTGESKVTLRRVVSVSPTSILVESCVDDTQTDTVNKLTKKSVAAPGQNQKYPVTLRAGLYPDGLWRWVESHADRGSTC